METALLLSKPHSGIFCSMAESLAVVKSLGKAVYTPGQQDYVDTC